MPNNKSRRSGGARFKTARRSTLSKLKTRQIKRASPSGFRARRSIGRFGSVRRVNARNRKSRARSTIARRAKEMGKKYGTAVKKHAANTHKSKMNNLNSLFGNFGLGGVKPMAH